MITDIRMITEPIRLGLAVSFGPVGDGVVTGVVGADSMAVSEGEASTEVLAGFMGAAGFMAAGFMEVDFMEVDFMEVSEAGMVGTVKI
jgi:hypothetical protein